MSAEHLNQGGGEENKFSRRDFLIKTAKLAAGGTAISALGFIGGNEIIKGKDGIVETREGIYTPIYELHDIGIRPEDIPQDTDALFREGGGSLKYIQDHIRETFEYAPYNDQQWIPSDIRDNTAKRSMPIVFGDVNTGVNPRSIGLAETSVAGAIFVSRWGIDLYERIKKVNQPLFKRRKVLNAALTIIGWYALSMGLTNVGYYLSTLQESKIVKRLALISDAKVSDIHPEITRLFLRNAIMANNLLITGDYLKNQLGRKPKIAYWVGAGHSGIEDFLQAGKGVCRNVIAAYPSWYLDDVVKNAGGIDDFCSSMLVKLSPPPHDPYENVEYVKVLDNKLKQKLLAKL